MIRRVVLFAALFFAALVAGAAFAIWIDYNPAGMSPAFYTEKMQHAIRVFTVPLPSVVILGVLFTIVSTFLARQERLNFCLLIGASVCIVAVALITAWGNIPINNQIKTWSINAPPPDWAELAHKWWWFQTLRMLSAIGGLSLLTVTALAHRK
jgi:energy-coupling factor transporter transmembrane protein EcfT